MEKKPFQTEHPGQATEVAIIKKYVRLHGKRVEPKQILSFISSIERAVLERKIRKASPHASKIEYIRQELRKLLKANNKPFTFLLDNRDSELPAIANTHVYENTIPIIKSKNRFIRIPPY